MRHVFDKAFKYTPAAATDANYLRAKFDRIRREQEKAAADTAQKVATIKPNVKGRAT
jgi:hypothetical protein